MTLATAAIFTGAITGALAPVYTITEAPSGGWLHAAHADGSVFIVYPVESTGDIDIVAVDEATQATAGPVTIADAFHQDAHSAPFVLVRTSDQRLMVWYSEHNGSTIYQRISTNPLDVSAWGEATSLDASLGGNLYTYATAFEYGGVLWLFYRDATEAGVEGHVAYSTSDDGGATWAAQTTLLVNSGELVYHAVHLSDRLDILASNGHPAQVTATVLHFYYDGTWRRSDGTAISGSPPFGIADLTTVYDGSDGTASLWDIARVDGSLSIAFDVTSGASKQYRVATWTGSVWTTETVGSVTAIAGTPHPPGVRLSRDVAGDVYACLPVDGVFQLHRLRDAVSLQLTSGATNHLLPHWVNGGGTTRILVLKGTYADSDDYSVGIVGSRL